MTMQISARDIEVRLQRHRFAILGMASKAGSGRSAGVVYHWQQGKLYFTTSETAWKAKHIKHCSSISVTVPIRFRLPFLHWLQVPPPTITFNAEAMIVADSPFATKMFKRIHGRFGSSELSQESLLVEVVPTDAYLTYGVGTPIWHLADPLKAQRRVPIIGGERRALDIDLRNGIATDR